MEEKFSEIAAMIGEPVRAKVLWALLDGRAYTSHELAVSAGTTDPNMSMHLAKMLKAGLLAVEAQGRHRYYRYSGEEVAYAVEALAGLMPRPEISRGVGLREDWMRRKGHTRELIVTGKGEEELRAYFSIDVGKLRHA